MRRIKVDMATDTVILKTEEWKMYDRAFNLLEQIGWDLYDYDKITDKTMVKLFDYFEDAKKLESSNE